eukprot:1442557-Heterocapsa_arctica.AAC.1
MDKEVGTTDHICEVIDFWFVLSYGNRSGMKVSVIGISAQTHRGKRKPGYKEAPHGGNGASTEK